MRDYDAAFDAGAEKEYMDRADYDEMMADAPDDDDEGYRQFWENYDEDDCWLDETDSEPDGQPDEYTEWQDYYGGDDWDHGQYDYDY